MIIPLAKHFFIPLQMAILVCVFQSTHFFHTVSSYGLLTFVTRLKESISKIEPCTDWNSTYS
jgi:hypothetical protein